ncbi:hypothetical protein [Ruminococcus sp.]|uniref:hypothetical protein n=1 Tax=Ruminococcus sp. TaxID=41978 RepID=UPI003AB26F98
MFKEADYYDRKMKIWDCDKKIDLEKPAPQNLRYTNTIDTIIEFYKTVRSLLFLSEFLHQTFAFIN